ncbi:MAG: hypothetical protein ACE5EO_04855, partial [Candidatus Krumholzibacteriia bacterium]
MKRLLYIAGLIGLAATAPEARGAVQASEPARVTYISVEAVYVNAGKKAGIAIGDTLKVVRGKRVITRLVVTSISSHSAACKPLDASARIKIGDNLTYKPRKRTAKKRSSTRGKKSTVKKGSSRRRPSRVVRRNARRRDRNRVHGYLSFQNQWQQSLTGSKFTWLQPNVNGKITVDKLAGKDVTLRIRHRSLYSFRAPAIDSPFSDDGWSHRLAEAALVFGKQGSPVEFGVGRVISPYIRGIGYIDGGYFSVKVSPRYRVGAAVGTEPDEESSAYRADRKKIGGFVTFEKELDARRRFSTTLALSASYAAGAVNREFFYVQNSYTVAQRLSAYQSVEIDVNRQWRRDITGSRVSFSNFYFTSNFFVSNFATFDFSFDARRNVRNYFNLNTPDSLFDSRLRKGLDGGFSLRLPRGISLRGTGGIRYGDEDSQDIRFTSLFMNVRNVYWRGHNLSTRISRSETGFTTSYRPTITYRMPIKRTRANFSVGGNLYKTGAISNNSYYFELGGSRSLNRRYYVSGSWRQYVSGPLQSL